MNNQTEFSRQLRREMTDAERHLWRRLRMRQMKGYKFRRQHPWRGYILDFVCLEAKLVVEIDGCQHFDNHAHDQRRTDRLESEGFQVLRIWNNDVMRNLNGVVTAIWNALPEMNSPPSQPSPLPGEGANQTLPNRSVPSPCKGEGQDGGAQQ